MQRPGGLRRGFSISYLLLKYTESSETHLLCGEKFYLVWMVGCGRVLHRDGGLTTFRGSLGRHPALAKLGRGTRQMRGYSLLRRRGWVWCRECGFARLPALGRVGDIAGEEGLAAPVRFGDLVAGGVEVVPGPGAEVGVFLHPERSAVLAEVAFFADLGTSGEVCGIHQFAIRIQELLGAVQHHLTTADQDTRPALCWPSGRILDGLGNLSRIRTRFVVGTANRVARILTACGFVEDPGFVEFDFDVGGVFGGDDVDGAVRALGCGGVADGGDIRRKVLDGPGGSVIIGERDVGSVRGLVLALGRVVVADEEEAAAGETDDAGALAAGEGIEDGLDRKSTRLNSSHLVISYAAFCL